MSEATSVLQRASVPRPEGTDLAEVWGDLPREAAERLGYDVLEDKQRRYELWSVLTELGIRPFTAKSVTEYKLQMMRESAPKHPVWDRFVLIVNVVSILGVVLSLGPIFLGWIISWKISAGFLGFVIACIAVSSLLSGKTVKSMPEWKSTSLKGYTEPVPEFALEMAVRIRSRLPQAEFTVHQLVQKEKVLDPFLAVEYGPECHYIAVWSEPAFGTSDSI